jgi:hypothetical protein
MNHEREYKEDYDSDSSIETYESMIDEINKKKRNNKLSDKKRNNKDIHKKKETIFIKSNSSDEESYDDFNSDDKLDSDEKQESIGIKNMFNKIGIITSGICVFLFLSFLMQIVELLTYLILPIVEGFLYLIDEKKDIPVNLLLLKMMIGSFLYVILQLPIIGMIIKYSIIVRMLCFIMFIIIDVKIDLGVISFGESLLEIIYLNIKKIKYGEIYKLLFYGVDNNNFSKIIKYISNFISDDYKSLIKHILRTKNREELINYLNQNKLLLLNHIINNDIKSIIRILKKIN